VRVPGGCKECGKRLMRVRRTLAEKLTRGAAFECTNCGLRQYSPSLFSLGRWPHASCPSCGTENLSVRLNPDPIEPVYTSPLRFVRRRMGGKLYRCQYCRLQFHDMRDLRERRSKDRSSQAVMVASRGAQTIQN
jgi:transcription elongation factor Elf1